MQNGETVARTLRIDVKLKRLVHGKLELVSKQLLFELMINPDCQLDEI